MKIPKDLNTEKDFLGCILLDNDSMLDVMDKVQPEDFASSANQIIYQTMIDLFMDKSPIDLLILTDKLNGKSIPVDYIASLGDGVVSSRQIGQYAKIIRDLKVKRDLIGVSQGLLEDIEGGNDSGEILGGLIDKAFELSQSKESNIKPLKKVLKKTLKQIEDAHNNGGVVGVTSGMENIDNILHGFKSKYYVLAGRPGTGKTALALNVAIEAVRDKPVLIFELEMPDEEIGIRKLASIASINTRELENGHIKDGRDWDKIMSACGRLSELDIFIDDSPNQTDLDIWTAAKRHKAKHGLGMIIVDYLQLVKSAKKFNKRQDEIEEISRNFKKMCKDVDVPVLALAQLNRMCDIQKRKPMESDLREAGGIEQDADVIMFTHLPSRIDERDEQGEKYSEEYCQLLIAKHRGGPTGYSELRFEKQYTKFSDWSMFG